MGQGSYGFFQIYVLIYSVILESFSPDWKHDIKLGHIDNQYQVVTEIDFNLELLWCY